MKIKFVTFIGAAASLVVGGLITANLLNRRHKHTGSINFGCYVPFKRTSGSFRELYNDNEVRFW